MPIPKDEQAELRELRKVEVVSKGAQAVLGVTMLITGFFFVHVFTQIQSLQEARYDHEARLRLLEYRLTTTENGESQK